MPGKLVHSGNNFDTYPVRGETIAAWVPLVLALIGTTICILMAQSLLDQKEAESPPINEFSIVDPVTTNEIEDKDDESEPADSPIEPEKFGARKTVDCPPSFSSPFPQTALSPMHIIYCPKSTASIIGSYNIRTRQFLLRVIRTRPALRSTICY